MTRLTNSGKKEVLLDIHNTSLVKCSAITISDHLEGHSSVAHPYLQMLLTFLKFKCMA